MKRIPVCLLAALVLPALSWADLRLPPKPTAMEKLGRGIANVTLAVTEILDSNYELLQEKGPTYAYTVGLAQGAITDCP